MAGRSSICAGLVVAMLFGIATTARGAAPVDFAAAPLPVSTASAGAFALHVNGDVVRRLGIVVDGAGGEGVRSHEFDVVAGSPLSSEVQGAGLAGTPRGIVVLARPLSIAPREGGGRAIIATRVVVGEAGWQWRDDDGDALFVIDHAMPIFDPASRGLTLRTGDLRITPALAQRLGKPDAAGIVIAEVTARLPLAVERTPSAPLDCGAPNWHGNPVPGGDVYQNDVFLTQLAAQFMRCHGCDGNGGADGLMIIAPSTTLTNNRNRGTFEPTVTGDPLGTSTVRWAADVPWYTKFNGNFAPYQNDQHPYLIWNLYRFDTDGAITQIGRSALKHAFATANLGINCERCNGGNVLGRACADPYSLSSNDSASELSLRSEVIAASGVWGRCGSLFDPDCDGDGEHTGITPYEMRMRVMESQLDPTLNPDATYAIEAFYVVREDRDIINTMGSRPLTFAWNPSSQLWNVGNGGPYRLGPAIDRWYETASPGTSSRAALLDTNEGSAKIAVRVRALGGGEWRYDFVVMNLDFGRAVTTGSEPNLRVLRNHGFDRFTVARSEQSAVSQVSFADGDLDASNDWTATTTTDAITWQAPSAAAGLEWGSLYRFTVIADRPPSAGDVALRATEPGAPQSFTLPVFAIGSSALFEDGFE